jgi:phenylalanyl-tRNA synthetase beta chain
MKIPLSWVREFVEFDRSIEDMAELLTLAGLEVEEIHYVGLPMPPETGRRVAKVTGIAWARDKIVVGAVLEVMPHPNADRLVLCRLNDGEREHVVLTGAPNLFPYKGQGPLPEPLKVAYAREGAQLYDGHKAGLEVMTLKRTTIRGVESYSMACSEKELGISDDHEGIILLDEDAPTGIPLADYMGDAVFDINITPNMARNANVLGVAREIAALTGARLRPPKDEVPWTGEPIDRRASIKIRNPDLNPRFVAGLIEGVHVGPSPYWAQRRLRLAGMRPINAIVDATNYAMLEIGQPLHAFDYDVLVRRAGGKPPTIITRLPEPGEHLTTLDGADRTLDDFTVLVADTAGALSIAGVMGGAESEVGASTKTILLEGAAWNFINIRRTVAAQRLASEAAYRFARGVHPAMAERGVRRGLQLMLQWAGGTAASGLLNAYPEPPAVSAVEVTPAGVERWLGIRIDAAAIAELLDRLGFVTSIDRGVVRVTGPDHRLDIGQGVIGKADVMEEIARMYGYDRIPETMIADRLPAQVGNSRLDREERVRDLLVSLGLQEIVTYRMTTPEREAKSLAPQAPPDDRPYVRLTNPIASDRVVMRHSLLASVLEAAERNARTAERLALFEIGPEFVPVAGRQLPDEPARLVLLLAGRREPSGWRPASPDPLDWFDLKGVVDGLLEGLKVGRVTYEPAKHASFHPGECARILVEGRQVGRMGSLHPQVQPRYDLPDGPVLMGDFDLDLVLAAVQDRHTVRPLPTFPPVLEDLAFVVDEAVPAARVEGAIRQAGGTLLEGLRLFDVYRGDQIGAAKKSLAYAVTYQADDRTLTDAEVATVRGRIVKRLEDELGAHLRT